MTASDPQLRIANLERELQWSQLKIQSLEERWRQHLIKLYGSKSETLSDLRSVIVSAPMLQRAIIGAMIAFVPTT